MVSYRQLEVRPVINATCHWTVYGGSVMWPEVLAAMADARRTCVDMRQLLDRAGEMIAHYTHAEAGYVVWKERLGVTARFEWLDPNTSVKNESDSWILTGGASYHVLNDFLKAQLDYTHREERYGKSLKNDSVVFQIQLNL